MNCLLCEVPVMCMWWHGLCTERPGSDGCDVMPLSQRDWAWGLGGSMAPGDGEDHVRLDAARVAVR